MSQDVASVLVASGAITVLVMPLLTSLTYRVADAHPVDRITRKAELLRAVTERVVAQFGSALDWGSRGRRFESCQPDQLNQQVRGFHPSGLLFCLYSKATLLVLLW